MSTTLGLDIERIRASVLTELDDTLGGVVREARLDARAQAELWNGIGERQLVTMLLQSSAAGLAALSFHEASYDRVLGAFARAMPLPFSLRELVLGYARPSARSAYRGRAPEPGGDLQREAELLVAAYLSARGVGDEPFAIALHGNVLELRGPRLLAARDDHGARLARGLGELAAAFSHAWRLVYARRP